MHTRDIDAWMGTPVHTTYHPSAVPSQDQDKSRQDQDKSRSEGAEEDSADESAVDSPGPVRRSTRIAGMLFFLRLLLLLLLLSVFL